mgnify:CR=1 FL=1
MDNYSSNQLFKIIENGNINNNPKRMIPWEKLQELINDCVDMNVKAIQVTGGGEPTVHPQFNEFCETVLSSNISLAVVTNGLLMNQKRAEILAHSAWVRISVDCAKPESYSRIRDVPAAEFEIVAKNVKYLTSIPDRKTVVGIGFVVTQDNYKEIYDGCVQFKKWGADNVRISAVFQNDGHNYFSEISNEIEDQISRSLTLSTNTFKVFNNFKSRYDDLELGNPDYSFCPYMNLTTYIGGDQNVYTCCVNAYNERGLVGSIKDQSFKSLWESKTKQEFFGDFDAKSCIRCMFNDKNRFINGLLRKPTVHDDFV